MRTNEYENKEHENGLNKVLKRLAENNITLLNIKKVVNIMVMFLVKVV